MCGPVTVNLNACLASALARWHASGRSSVPLVTGPSTTPGGRVRKRIPGSDRYAVTSSNVSSWRTPCSGRTKYSIIPFVSGWLTSKRYSSPSQTTSTPACSCVAMTTRVASTSACSEGAATSHSGTGYEPTTVVWIRGAVMVVFARPGRTKSLRHLDRAIEELVRVRRLDVVRRLEADVGLDEVVVGGHAAVVEVAERDRLRELVAHQHLDQAPVLQLVVELERAVGLDERLHARVRIGDARRERLLRHLDERGDDRLVLLQVIAVDDHRVAVGVEAGVLPRDEAHVVAELLLEDVVDVVERRRRVDRLRLQGGELRVGVDVDPRHRVGVHVVRLGERRPDRSRAIAGGVADLLAGEVLHRLDARALQPVEALRRVGVDVEHAHG